MNLATTPGIRAAVDAGRFLHRKDDNNLDPILKALEENNRVALERFKAIEDAQTKGTKRLDDVERKANRAGLFAGGTRQAETWGAQFTQSPDLKSFAENRARPSTLRLEVKDAVSVLDTGALGTPTRDTVVTIPRRRLSVRDLLPRLQVGSNTVEYPFQTGRNNAATTVPEKGVKPESGYTFELRTAQTRVIAHWIPATIQILTDVPQLAGLIDSELRYGLDLARDAQLLYGAGLGNDLTGMMPAATAFAAPFPIAQATMLDTIALAILQTALADLPADGIILHPSDWTRMRLQKDTQGNYILGDPGAQIEPRLFGLPVIPTTAIVVDHFLVGDFQVAATIYDRWEPRVEASTEHADFFTRNMVAIRAEERLALAIKQPLALVKGAFGNPQN